MNRTSTLTVCIAFSLFVMAGLCRADTTTTVGFTGSGVGVHLGFALPAAFDIGAAARFRFALEDFGSIQYTPGIQVTIGRYSLVGLNFFDYQYYPPVARSVAQYAVPWFGLMPFLAVSDGREPDGFGAGICLAGGVDFNPVTLGSKSLTPTGSIRLMIHGDVIAVVRGGLSMDL